MIRVCQPGSEEKGMQSESLLIARRTVWPLAANATEGRQLTRWTAGGAAVE